MRHELSDTLNFQTRALRHAQCMIIQACEPLIDLERVLHGYNISALSSSKGECTYRAEMPKASG
jgi:hypothetical protein